MIQETANITMSNQFDSLLHKVQKQGDQIVITHAGKPVAALVDFALFEKMCRHEARFQQLSDSLNQAFVGFSEEEVTALVDEAIHAGRRH